MQDHFDLDKVLINFPSEQGNSTFTIRDAVEGVQIFGGIGSGKSSGSGKLLARKYLAAGFGGLVHTAKADEKDTWIEYCKETNRFDDLVIIEPGGKHAFNFLEYESRNKLGEIPITENIVQVLKTVIRASEEKSGGKSDDPFWETALDMLIFNTLDLCLLAFGKASVEQMYNIVMTAPKKESTPKEQDKNVNSFASVFDKAYVNVKEEIDKLNDVLSEAEKKKCKEDDVYYNQVLAEKAPSSKLFESMHQFFFESYKNLSEKTRSIIEFSFSGFLFRLLKEPVYSLFCSKASTVVPENCLTGKIILLNIPVKHYNKVGRDIQVMFKYIWQRAMEKRDTTKNNRPVFLYADESQHFLHEYDSEYQATARSSRIATVYISQNIPNYHANMGGTNSDHKVKSFLGTLGTKIFHANADIETNKYASELIGEAYMEDVQRSRQIGGDFSKSESVSYRLEKIIRPEEFSGLLTGGPGNQYEVEGYVHRQGKTFIDGSVFRKIVFRQKLPNDFINP